MKYLWIPLMAIMSFNVFAGNVSNDPFNASVVVNSVVLFDNDSSVVSDADKHRIAHEFSGAPTDTTYEITGRASEIGSTSYNKELSLHRAKSVHTALGSPSKVSLVALGEMDAPIRLTLLDARVDRNVGIHAVWSMYKPTFGQTSFLVPGPLFHLQGVEPGVAGAGILGLGVRLGI